MRVPLLYLCCAREMSNAAIAATPAVLRDRICRYTCTHMQLSTYGGTPCLSAAVAMLGANVETVCVSSRRGNAVFAYLLAKPGCCLNTKLSPVLQVPDAAHAPSASPVHNSPVPLPCAYPSQTATTTTNQPRCPYPCYQWHCTRASGPFSPSNQCPPCEPYQPCFSSSTTLPSSITLPYVQPILHVG